MYCEQTDVCFSTAPGGQRCGCKITEAPLSPRPSSIPIGGVTQNFGTKPCPDCADGWVREPDGYGCVQWTLCYRCGGDGVLHER